VACVLENGRACKVLTGVVAEGDVTSIKPEASAQPAGRDKVTDIRAYANRKTTEILWTIRSQLEFAFLGS